MNKIFLIVSLLIIATNGLATDDETGFIDYEEIFGKPMTAGRNSVNFDALPDTDVREKLRQFEI